MSEEKLNHLIPWTTRGKLLAIYAVVFEFLLMVMAPIVANVPRSIGGFPGLWVFTNAVGWLWIILGIATGYMKR